MSEEIKNSKQAVLIIHGIGEQRPMDTLRGFAHAVWDTNTDIHSDKRKTRLYSNPDKISGNLDLRRLTTSYNISNVGTDFFEFYWAHMMEGNKLMHVWGWLKRLLWMGPKKLRYPLNNVWWLLIGIIIITALIASALYTFSQSLGFSILRWFIYAIILYFINYVINALNDYGGDAARYLDPSPKNVQQRQNIRKAGINVIKSIHDSGQYDRIIVVGHSLGSVIAYDILSHSWPDFKYDIPKGKHLNDLKAVADYETDNPDAFVKEKFHQLQLAAFKEQREKGNKWLVTDLITMGSPLTYSDILLAADKEDLDLKIDQTEFPTCPPQLDSKGFIYNDENGIRHMTLHSLFAITRWTNLYFPQKKVIYGDIIGGPISELFGNGINDIEVATNKYNKKLSHTKYWKMYKDENSHIKALRDALDLTLRVVKDEEEE